MYEDHIENSYVAKSMLQPELVVTVSCGTRLGNYSRSDEREYSSREEPEICYIEKRLGLGNHEVGAEYNAPSADRNRQMVNGVSAKGGNAHKTPEIGHLTNYHSEGKNEANRLFVLEIP